MAFFGLFKSRHTREAELRSRVRQGTMRIHKFVSRLSKQADDYSTLARRAYDLDDQEQFRQLASGYLQCRETINRWERYMIKLRSLELRKNEAEATREFLSSMNALTSAILNGVRPEDLSTLNSDMEAALERSEELDEALAGALDDSVNRIDHLDQKEAAKLVNAGTDGTKSVEWKSRSEISERRDQEFWLAMERQRVES
jgi:hypothetical protein